MEITGPRIFENFEVDSMSIYFRLLPFMNICRKQITDVLQEMMALVFRLRDLCEANFKPVSAFEQFARGLFVWRKPYPKIHELEVCLVLNSCDLVGARLQSEHT
jgi:hypothetical protein